MQMYPSYKFRDALEEYAIIFFRLLDEGYRLRYDKYYMLAQLAMVPHLEDKDRRAFMRQLDWAAKDPDDILNTDEDSDIEGIKRILG